MLAVAENQPICNRQNRMTERLTFSTYAARLRDFIRQNSSGELTASNAEEQFQELATQLFGLQREGNPAYRTFCQARKVTAESVADWRSIPAVATAAFKEFEVTSLPEAERTRVFHSSGTTGERPSRHFHNAESLAIYEASLLPWFETHVGARGLRFIMLTPTAEQAPHSSLAHMFDAVGRKFAAADTFFMGRVEGDGSWTLDLERTVELLREAITVKRPVRLLGTAFSFVHLLDYLAEVGERLHLPIGSRVLETGGYKGRSRSLPKAELHSLITQWLGVAAQNIVCEYGMSELSSQAYDREVLSAERGVQRRVFQFPPWARVQVVSPETGREVGEGETGLIRVFDLANVRSVMAIQTEDLGIRRGSGFELIGRATLAEPRGCSLMSV
ncbi:MAG: putative acyl protein synthase/acyl-CoA reductase-like protein [Pedosphaera sp.]|nr:putative acyl protein synthase/acyl-CoA reductase-like protein [Pedosphaera sp.]